MIYNILWETIAKAEMISISNNTGMAWGCCQRNRKCGKCNEQNPDFLSAARGHEAVIAEFTKLSLKFEWWPISYRLRANGLITCQLWTTWPIKAGIHVEPVNIQVFYYLILFTKNPQNLSRPCLGYAWVEGLTWIPHRVQTGAFSVS